MVTYGAMKEVADSVLKSAIKEIEELENLFIEDQFRHIVVRELDKNSKIDGKFKPGNSYPKIVLEFMWKKGGRKMDIAILGSSTKGKSKRYSYPKHNRQPLAIELKVNGDEKKIRQDVSRVLQFLNPRGNSTFKNGMVLVGAKTKYRPSKEMISSTQTGFLFGCIDDKDKPYISWLKKPESKKKPPKKQQKVIVTKKDAWKLAEKNKRQTFTHNGKSNLKVADYYIRRKTKRLVKRKKN